MPYDGCVTPAVVQPGGQRAHPAVEIFSTASVRADDQPQIDDRARNLKVEASMASLIPDDLPPEKRPIYAEVDRIHES